MLLVEPSSRATETEICTENLQYMTSKLSDDSFSNVQQ